MQSLSIYVGAAGRFGTYAMHAVWRLSHLLSFALQGPLAFRNALVSTPRGEVYAYLRYWRCAADIMPLPCGDGTGTNGTTKCLPTTGLSVRPVPICDARATSGDVHDYFDEWANLLVSAGVCFACVAGMAYCSLQVLRASVALARASRAACRRLVGRVVRASVWGRCAAIAVFSAGVRCFRLISGGVFRSFAWMFGYLAIPVLSAWGFAQWAFFRVAGWHRPVLLEFTPVRTGFYEEGGRRYFRDSRFAPAYLAVPSSLRVRGEEHEVTYSFHSTTPTGVVAEALLPSLGRIVPLIGSLPTGLVFLGASNCGRYHGTGVGWREGDWLFTAKHCFSAMGAIMTAGHVTLCVPGSKPRFVEVALSSCKFAHLNKFSEVSPFDIVAVQLPQSAWCSLGVRSLGPKDYSSYATGRITVYGMPDQGAASSEGSLYEDINLATQGMLRHDAHTMPGFSGCPLLLRAGGRDMVVGMHVGHRDDMPKHNLAVSSHIIYRLRKFLKLVPETDVAPLIKVFQESREPGARQAEADVELLARGMQAADYEETLTYGTGERVGAELAHIQSEQAFRGYMSAARAQVYRFRGAEALAALRAGSLITGAQCPPLTLQLPLLPPVRSSDGDQPVSPSSPVGEVHSAPIVPPSSSPSVDAEPAPPVGNPPDEQVSVEGEVESVAGDSPRSLHYSVVSDDDAASECGSEEQGEDTASLADSSTPPPGLVHPESADRPDHIGLTSRCFAEKKWWADNLGDVPPSSPPPYPPCDTAKVTPLQAYVRFMEGDLEVLADVPGSFTPDELRSQVFYAYHDKFLADGEISWELSKPQKPMLDSDGLPCFTHIGKTESRALRGNHKEKPARPLPDDFLDDAAACGVDLRKDGESAWYMPPAGRVSETSLRNQSKVLSRGNFTQWAKTVGPEGVNAVYEDFVAEYIPGPTEEPTPGDIGFGEDFLEWWDARLTDMDSSKSTGWAACHINGAKEAWTSLSHNRLLLLHLVACRMLLRACYPLQELAVMGPEEMVKQGLVSPRVLFTKMEAHSLKKKQGKAWRQIWAVCFVDQMAQEIAHYRLNKRDMKRYHEGYLKCQSAGLGHDDDGLDRIARTIRYISGSEGARIDSKDASSWDLTVPRDGIMVDVQRRLDSLSLGPRAYAAKTVMLVTEALVTSAHVVCCQGSLWRSERFGITGSGLPSTTAQNCSVRGFGARAAGAKRLTVAGDDILHTEGVDQGILASFGVRTKDLGVEPSVDGPHEFTSHEFTFLPGGQCQYRFCNFGKLLAHLYFRTPEGEAPDQDRVAGCVFALRHNKEDLAKLQALFDKRGWGLLPEGRPSPEAMD